MERLNRVERVRASRERATATLGSNAGRSLVDLRRSVVASLEGFALSNVRLSVASGRPPVSARVSLSAEGTFSEVIRLTGAIAGSGTGLVLDNVRVRPAPAGRGAGARGVAPGEQAVRRRLLVLLLGLTSAMGLFAVATAPAKRPAPALEASPPPSVPQGALVDRTAPAPVLRNVFEYGSRLVEGSRPSQAPPPPAMDPTPPPSQAPEPVRLVGIVSRGGSPKAALVIDGEVVVLATGQQAEGYTLLSIDSDTGVRVKGPEGHDLSLQRDP